VRNWTRTIGAVADLELFIGVREQDFCLGKCFRCSSDNIRTCPLGRGVVCKLLINLSPEFYQTHTYSSMSDSRFSSVNKTNPRRLASSFITCFVVNDFYIIISDYNSIATIIYSTSS